MKKLMFVSLLALMALAFGGCANTGGPFQSNTANSALAGGALGFGAGHLIGGKKAAATGALVGALGGAAVGQQQDMNRAAYPPPPPPGYGAPAPRSY